MALSVRPDIIASLDKLGPLIDKALTAWNDHLQRIESKTAASPKHPQITASTDLTHDLTILRAKCHAYNERIQELQRHRCPLQDISIPDLIARNQQKRTSTETEACNLKRTLAEAEDSLSRAVPGLAFAESIITMGMRVLESSLLDLTAYETGEKHAAAARQEEKLEGIQAGIDRLRISATDEQKLAEIAGLEGSLREEQAEGRRRVVVQLDAREARREHAWLTLLLSASRLGMRMARQRMVIEFFRAQ